MSSKNLQHPSIPNLVTAKKTNTFHTVDPTDPTDDPAGTSFRGNFEQLAGFTNSQKGLIKIVDKAGAHFTNLATAHAYIDPFTSATITNESFTNGIYYFTVPNNSSFALVTDFLAASDAYIVDELGLINQYGTYAFSYNNGNNIFLNCAFGADSFTSSSGNNTFNNCSFSDRCFVSCTGNNTLGSCTFANNCFNGASGVNVFGNILLTNISDNFAQYSTGKFYLNGTIGTNTTQNYANFFLTSTASIFVKRENYTNNSGGIEGDLAIAITNGATVFFGGIEIITSYGTLQDVTDNGHNTTNNIDFYGVTDGLKKASIHPHDGGEGTIQAYDYNGQSTAEIRGNVGVKVYKNDLSAPLFDVIRDNGTDIDKVKYKGTEIENTANKGAANGYAPLNSSTKIDSAYLPAYVDDVLEVANFAALPVTGTSGIIYVTVDTNFEYRWSGSTYIRLVSSPGTTDALIEGITNLYFQTARVLATALTGYISGAGTITATDTILQAIQKLNGNIAAISLTPIYDSASARYSGVDYNSAFGTLISANPLGNYLYGIPVVVGEPHTITAIKVEVVASSNPAGRIRIGLYTENSVGYANSLVEESTELDASTAGIKAYTFTTPRAVSGRKYFLAFTCNTGSISIRYITGGYNLLPNDGANVGFLLLGARTYGALPATFPSGYAVNTSAPGFLITKQ